MEENRLKFGVGVLVVASVAVTIILTFLFGAIPSLLTRHIHVTATFDATPGVSTNTRVLRDGVRIGRVSDVRLLPDGGVQLTMLIEPRYSPTPAYVPRITMGSIITGDASIEFVRRSEEELIRMFDGQAGSPPNQMLDPEELKLITVPARSGDFIGRGTVAGDPFAVLLDMEYQVQETLETMRLAGDAVAKAGGSVTQLAGNVSDALGDGGQQVRDLTTQTSAAADELRATLAEVRQLLGDEDVQRALREAITGLPELKRRAEGTLLSVAQAAESFESVGNEVQQVVVSAGQTVSNVEEITRPFAEQSDEFAARMINTLDELQVTLAAAGQFANALNDGDGTLRKIIEDDDLYLQVKRVIENVEFATARVRPILDDFRIISDKLARDPRQLGVKGALDQRPSGMGFK